MTPYQSKLVSDVFVLRDERHEPLTVIVEVFFKKSVQFSSEQLRAALAKLIKDNPSISSWFNVTYLGVEQKNAPPDASFFDCVFQDSKMPREEFLYQFIESSQPPLFRIWTGSQEGMAFVFHHSLFDGRATLDLISCYLNNLFSLDTDLGRYSSKIEKKIEITNSRSLFLREILLKKEKLKTVDYFGDPKKRIGQHHSFARLSWKLDIIQSALQILRQKLPKLTIHDLITAATFRAIGRLLKEKSKRDFISVQTPVDMRKYLGEGRSVGNWSSMIKIDIPKKLIYDEALEQLRCVTALHIQAKVKQTEWDLIYLMEAAKTVGFFNSACITRKLSGHSWRASRIGQYDWDGQGTSNISNLGFFHHSNVFESLVDRVFLYPPVYPPTNPMLGVVTYDGKVNVSVLVSDANMTKDETHDFVQTLSTEMAALLEVDQSQLLLPPVLA